MVKHHTAECFPSSETRGPPRPMILFRFGLEIGFFAGKSPDVFVFYFDPELAPITDELDGHVVFVGVPSQDNVHWEGGRGSPGHLFS